MTYRSFALGTLLSALVLVHVHFQAGDARAAEPPKNKANPSKTRVGIYDSRAIAAAYWTPERMVNFCGLLEKERQEAEAHGNAKKAQEAFAKIWAHRGRVRKQVFSTAPVDDILKRIKDRLPGIARRAKVGPIVSKWDKRTLSQHKSSELVDVTLLLVAEFEPDKATLQRVWDVKEHPPIPLSQLEKEIKSIEKQIKGKGH